MQFVVRLTGPELTDPETVTSSDRLVAIDADESHTVADLCRQLGVQDVVVERTGRPLPHDRALGDVDLRSGDGLRSRRGIDGDLPSVRGAPLEPAAIVLGVVGGPQSGRSIRLPPGRHSVGRSRLADVRLDDPSLSRHHLDLTVAIDGTCAVHVIGAPTNGVSIDGREVGSTATFSPGHVLRLGASCLGLRSGSDEPPGDPAPDAIRSASFDFRRTPYRPPIVQAVDADPIGPIPERPERRRFGFATAIAPLVAGGAMFLITRQPTFLALTLLSPVIVAGTAIEDRRSGRRSWKRDREAFRDRLDARVEQLERLRRAERAVRSRAAPDVAELVARALHLKVDLWSRAVDAPDALNLRLGLGIDDVRFPVALAPGGAADLRDDAETAIAHLRTVAEVPITVDIGAAPVLALQGERVAVGRLANALVAQLVTLHSPHDVVFVAAVAPDRGFDWWQWLPHARTATSPLPGPHLVDDDRIDDVIAALTRVGEARLGDRTRADLPDPWPRVVAVLDAELAPDPVRLARLLDTCRGISVVWLAGEAAEVPRQAHTVVEVRRDAIGAVVAHSWSTDPDVVSRHVVAEQVGPEVGERLGRSLAPIRDASTATRSNAIPRTVPLGDVVAVDRDTVVAAWRTPRASALRVPLGIGVDGPLVVDLVADGPHTLIGGTSGAGKSELLQSMVAALAAAYPPTHLNFLFVDYKGGASTQAFARSPHSVGHVTNLTDDLAERALISLRAELRRRMALLEGRAKDLAELLVIDPAGTPPSLVIVVDEFATLVSEVPDFMAGIIDVAQRGRSLGIHLVLATQRPSGAVDENILANTNLRVALRMLDRADSTAVLASPAAADIPVPLRGRALARVGPRQLIEFQSPWASAPVRAPDSDRRPLRIEAFGFRARTGGGSAVASRAGTLDAAPPTRRQLDALIDATLDASDRLGLTPPRRPWCDPLPDRIPLADVLGEVSRDGAELDARRYVPVGRLDDPVRQRQEPAVLDLAAGATMLVAAPGTGATTFVRTVVTALGATGHTTAQRAPAVAALVIDMAGRDLADLAGLPHVIDVARGDDLESVTRHLLWIDGTLAERRAGGVASTAPRIAVCIDGADALADALLDPGSTRDADRWLGILGRLLLDGRQLGVPSVLTARRRSALPARLQTAVAHRLVLRQHDPSAYADLGISPSGAAALDTGGVGRSLLDGRTLVQLAIVDDPPALAGGASDAGDGPTALPDRIELVELGELVNATDADDVGSPIVIGVADVTGRPVSVDVGWDDLVVCGPPRSGRSTALATVAAQLGPRVAVIASRGERRSSSLRATIERVLADTRATTVVVDDVDHLDAVGDPLLAAAIDELARRDDIGLVGALDVRSMVGYSASPLVARLRRTRHLLVLRPDGGPDTAQLIGRPVRFRPGLRRPPGRGVLVVDGEPAVIQVATSPLRHPTGA